MTVWRVCVPALLRVPLRAGIPSLVYAHELTNTLMYAGPVMDLVTALSDLPAGGQVRCRV